jgi:hypothetical protein
MKILLRHFNAKLEREREREREEVFKPTIWKEGVYIRVVTMTSISGILTIHYNNNVALGYNDLGLFDTSIIESYIQWHKLMPH